MRDISFTEMRAGERAMVAGFSSEGSRYRRKLLSMGLTRGVEFEFVKAAPLGDPVEIRVRGYSLSLRRSEAEVLILKEVSR